MALGHNESLDHWQPMAARYLWLALWASQIFIAGPQGQQNIKNPSCKPLLKGYYR